MLAVVELKEVIKYINTGGYECDKVVLKGKEFRFVCKNQTDFFYYIQHKFPMTCGRKLMLNFYK